MDHGRAQAVAFAQLKHAEDDAEGHVRLASCHHDSRRAVLPRREVPPVDMQMLSGWPLLKEASVSDSSPWFLIHPACKLAPKLHTCFNRLLHGGT